MTHQRGSTLVGVIIGVVVGLAVALAVAVYVTKVPVPFMNKGQSRSPEQDAAEAKKNKDWDPNAPLYGKNPAKPAEAGGESTDAAKEAPAKPEVKPAVTADPIGDLVKSKGGASDPFNYFVQVGAYRNAEDAESQRAKLSLSGVEAKVSEHEQAGRQLFRVRVGPFAQKDAAEQSKDKLESAGYTAALVRVQR